MNSNSHSMRQIAAILVLFIVSCVEVKEPSAPDVIVQGDESGTSSCNNCTNMAGRTYRFTSLRVLEPSGNEGGLADLLDGMFENEISNYILNVLFHVQDATAGITTAFDSMTLVAGPGWREPATPYVVPKNFAVTSFKFLEGLQIDISMEAVAGYQCQIKNRESTSLYFHLGPLNDPLMCAPLLVPANATPIKDLSIRFGFNDDCSKIEDGYMRGCLSSDDVDRICMCLEASECSREGGDNGISFPTGEIGGGILTQYCTNACGHSETPGAYNWLSFGANMRTFQIAKTCITPEGDEGYLLEVIFDAEEVTVLFDTDSIQ